MVSGKGLERYFPMVHAVGRASISAPRLIDITWGPARARKVTLVGKGVCFDTGGLDIKPASGMLLMKKDMGGAANVLGLAAMIMAAKLPVRLRVLVPAVRELDLVQCVQAERYPDQQKGPYRRDRQHPMPRAVWFLRTPWHLLMLKSPTC